MSVFAVIDIGSNSVKLHVARAGDAAEVLADLTEVCGLGEGLKDTGRLGDEPMERTASVVAGFADKARELGAVEVVAVGTMALRSASNTEDFLSLVEQKCGLRVEVVPGEEEARLSYLAVLSGLGAQRGRLAIFDTGGGSTEFIFGAGEEIDRQFSLNIGSLRFTEDFCKSDPVTEEELASMLSSLSDEFGDLGDPVDTLVGMGGTLTSLGAVMHEMKDYDPDVIQGSILSLEEVERQITMFRSMTIEERREVTGLMPKRGPVILAGASIVKTIMGKLKVNSLTISDRGLRHGLMFDRFIRNAD